MFSYYSKVVGFLASILIVSISLFSQDKKSAPMSTPQVENEEIVRISSNLIQIGVTVLDKNGGFEDKLKSSDFDIQIDGKPVNLDFFELRKSNINVNEKISNPSASAKTEPQLNPNQKRTFIFFIDDVHLSADSITRTKKVISNFIDNELQDFDIAAVVCTSGKIGFLQQFTDSKTMLKAAVEKVVYNRNWSADDKMEPPMTEYEAQLVSQLDPEITQLFVNADPAPGDLESKKERVRMRARSVLAVSSEVLRKTFTALDSVIRASGDFPGRKALFFFSDGFVPAFENSNYRNLMQKVTDAASRTNTVIYSFDTKGLDAALPVEGTSARNPMLANKVLSGQRFDLQIGLADFANNTGGEIVRNTNDLDVQLKKYSDEASSYYLLAWQEDSNITDSDKKKALSKKITVKVKSRPELKVRFQNSFLARAEENPKAQILDNSQNPSITDLELNKTLVKRNTVNSLPIAMTADFIETVETGSVINATVEIDKQFVGFTDDAQNSRAEVDILGVLFNAQGKTEETFRKLLTMNKTVANLSESKFRFDHQIKTKPGLYQLRIAARDVQTGRLGSVNKWIEIPDLSKQNTVLSSIILSEVSKANTSLVSGITKSESVQTSVTRNFRKTSKLRYLIIIYNLAGSNSEEETEIRTKVIHNNKTILETPFNPVVAKGQDPTRLAFAGEIALNAFGIGRYKLEITTVNKKTNINTTKSAYFMVEY